MNTQFETYLKQYSTPETASRFALKYDATIEIEDQPSPFKLFHKDGSQNTHPLPDPSTWTALGSGGWNRLTNEADFALIDVDVDHGGNGMSQEAADALVASLKGHADVYRSKSGNGYHAIVHFETPLPCHSQSEYQAINACVRDRISKLANIELKADAPGFLWLASTAKNERSFQIVLNSSAKMDVSDYTPAPPKPAATPTNYSPLTLTEIVTTVAKLPQKTADDYELCFRVACALKRTSEETGFDLLPLFHEHCRRSSSYNKDPDWPNKKWTSVDHSENPTTFATLIYWTQHEPQTQSATNPFLDNGFSFSSLMEADFKTEWLIEDLFCKDSMLLVAAMEKSWKTSLTVYASLCMASGVPFLGHETKNQKVGIFSGESGNKNIRDMFSRMSKELGVEPGDNLFYTPVLPHFAQPMEHFLECIVSQGLEIVVVDPAYLCMDGQNANNSFEMGPQLKSFADSCATAGATPILLHHLNKNSWKQGRFSLSDVAWAGFRENAPQWWALRKETDFRDGHVKLLLDCGGRDGQDAELILDLNESKEDGQRTWNVDYMLRSEHLAAKKDSKERDQINSVTEKVLEALKIKPLICTDIKTATASRLATSTFLNGMVESGLLEIVQLPYDRPLSTPNERKAS